MDCLVILIYRHYYFAFFNLGMQLYLLEVIRPELQYILARYSMNIIHFAVEIEIQLSIVP